MKGVKYYDWNVTLSYDADVTMVVGARGIGKTYGIRLQCIRDYIKNKTRFVELVRFKNELSSVQTGYFDRIETNDEFKGKIFKTDSNFAFIADKPDDENKKPKWELLGYFLALTQAQAIKKRTFDRVKRIVFDEAILDRHDRFHRYLSREFSILANIVDTVSRERSDIECISPRIYLLGNALDVMNPYFMAYGVGVPKYGFSWHRGKTMLLNYVKDDEYSKEKSIDTVAGRMLAGTEEGMNSNNNEFSQLNDDFIMKKTKAAKFIFGVKYSGNTFAIWEDWTHGYYFITGRIPKNTPKPVFAITLDDNRINYIAARRAEEMLRGFTEAHYAGLIRYENISLRENFKEVLEMFGVR
jgi:hypothetical protein